jgi:hypothetical protein
MSTTSDQTTPTTPEEKLPLADRVDAVVDKAQVKLDAVVDAAQDKARAAGEHAAAKRTEMTDGAKQHAVDALDATQAKVDQVVDKAKDKLES